MKYIIATHGKLADGFASSIRVIMGNESVYTINAYIDGCNDVASHISAILEKFEPAERVIVFTDVLGGSVNQEVAALMKKYKFKVITGINLALLMDIIMQGDQATDESIEESILEARRQVVHVLPFPECGEN